MSFSNERVDHIRRRAEQATPGPWAWFGNGSSQQIYLATQRLGRHIVMDFARWGMRGAQPTFFGGRTVSLDASGLKRISGGEFQDTKSNAVYEVAPSATDINDPRLYRKDIIGIRNPDAEFLAHSREDIDDLLKEVDVRGRIIADGVKITADGGTTVRQVGWFCEHTYGTRPRTPTWTGTTRREGSRRGATSSAPCAGTATG
jgi:hypothetical protein